MTIVEETCAQHALGKYELLLDFEEMRFLSRTLVAIGRCPSIQFCRP